MNLFSQEDKVQQNDNAFMQSDFSVEQNDDNFETYCILRRGELTQDEIHSFSFNSTRYSALNFVGWFLNFGCNS